MKTFFSEGKLMKQFNHIQENTGVARNQTFKMKAFAEIVNC